MIIRLILVELRVISDLNYGFYIIRAKMYYGVMTLYCNMSAIRVYYLYASYNKLYFVISSLWLHYR